MAMAMARCRLGTKIISSLCKVGSARTIVSAASLSRVPVPMATRLGIRSKVASDIDMPSLLRVSGTWTSLLGNRSKGNETEEADRKAYILLSRYGTLNPKGKRREEEDLFNMEPRIQTNELMKRYLEEGRVLELFQIWKEDVEKVYEDPEEEEKRFEAFETTLKYVVKRNPECGYTLGLNGSAADFPEEIQRMYPRMDLRAMAKRKRAGNKMVAKVGV